MQLIDTEWAEVVGTKMEGATVFEEPAIESESDSGESSNSKSGNDTKNLNYQVISKLKSKEKYRFFKIIKWNAQAHIF